LRRAATSCAAGTCGPTRCFPSALPAGHDGVNVTLDRFSGVDYDVCPAGHSGVKAGRDAGRRRKRERVSSDGTLSERASDVSVALLRSDAPYIKAFC